MAPVPYRLCPALAVAGMECMNLCTSRNPLKVTVSNLVHIWVTNWTPYYDWVLGFLSVYILGFGFGVDRAGRHARRNLWLHDTRCPSWVRNECKTH